MKFDSCLRAGLAILTFLPLFLHDEAYAATVKLNLFCSQHDGEQKTVVNKTGNAPYSFVGQGDNKQLVKKDADGTVVQCWECKNNQLVECPKNKAGKFIAMSK